jgi:hypothetical protein
VRVGAALRPSLPGQQKDITWELASFRSHVRETHLDDMAGEQRGHDKNVSDEHPRGVLGVLLGLPEVRLHLVLGVLVESAA